MREGQFGAQVPVSKNFFDPELLIVPLVAFDRQGGRLGYGGGFYDRTLEKLKMKQPVLAVGFAYSCQEIEQVPLEMTDQSLDFVITEKAVLDLRSEP
jgi:5-formyltetrahydrofolate cyclo-ligase